MRVIQNQMLNIPLKRTVFRKGQCYMIYFDRYTDINDLLQFYLAETPNPEISRIMASDIANEKDAEIFSLFVWDVVDKIHDDEEAERLVLGRQSNTDMLPDLSYEITKYMSKSGFFNVWERVSDVGN